jgi:hypothetical protein
MSTRRKVSASAKDATAILVIKNDFGPEHDGTFRRDLPANPAFNGSNTTFRGSSSPKSEAKLQVINEAKDGSICVDFGCLRFVPAAPPNGSMSSNQSGEGDILRELQI